MTESDALKLLLQLFEDAVSAAQPSVCLPPFLPGPPKGRTIVVGAGKASAAMAKTLEDHWAGDISGLVLTRYRHGAPCKKIEVVEAGHPLPDTAGEGAARRTLDIVRHLSSDDLVIALMSGGGSALLALPAAGITLDQKRTVTSSLLKSGAPISAINTVRKHLSAIKGGRLAAAAHPARVVTLMISDVPGDDPAIIASGPTVGDPSTLTDAKALLTRYSVTVAPSVARALEDAANETIRPTDPRLAKNKMCVIASARTSLDAAATSARALGYDVLDLGDAIEGEARRVAAEHARLALERKRQGWRGIILSGGELTVTVGGAGSGGRNREYALALALALNGTDGIAAVACDTDEIDGIDDAAGAVILPSTLARAAELRLDGAQHLNDNNSGAFFEHLADMIVTGRLEPTSMTFAPSSLVPIWLFDRDHTASLKLSAPRPPVSEKSSMRIVALAVLTFMVTLVATPALAKFELCNETRFPVGAALGFHDGKLWRAAGWWIVHPKSCTTLIDTPLIARYYYVYAVHMGPGGRWDGNKLFCVHETDAFSIPYEAPCRGPKLVSVGFFEVDTGSSRDYIQRLQD